MTIYIINGPNLNLVGIREPEIYGTQNFDTLIDQLSNRYPNIDLNYYQSNVEGELINKIQSIGFSADGIIFNGGGYTHTSVALADAIAAITTPVIEVHISNLMAREEFRQHSMMAKYCLGMISGLGLQGYELALQHFIYLKNS